MEREHSTLSELIADLRHRAKLSHVKVGAAIHRSRWTSQHYEEGMVRPPPGYVAFIARAAHRQSSRARGAREAAQELLNQVNTAIILYYGRDDILTSWDELCALADRWVEENRHQRRGSKPPQGEGEPADEAVPQLQPSPGSPGLPAPRWQLRAATPDFVGREAERERLVAGLRGTGPDEPQATLACIRGLGGAGKTELVYRVAQELTGEFPDGQLLIELAGSRDLPLRPEDALARVVRSFLPQEELPAGLAELRGRYRSVLHGRRVLIVADDARDAAQLRDLLPPAGNALLITTRWRFPLEGLIDVNLIELGGLRPSDAERLLLSLCPRIGTAAPELAALCGFLPLALRIAGGRLASDGTLRVERFLAQLRDERSRLVALEPEGAERGVAAVLDLSYAALSPLAQLVLAQLSVFPASFVREALPDVVELSGAPAEPAIILDQVVSELHCAGLVEVDQAGERMWLHDLVRAFAAAQLAEPAEVRRRHAATYAHLAQRLAEWSWERGREILLPILAAFDAERPNFDVGIAWVIEHAETPGVWPILVDYLTGIQPIGQLRLHPQEVLLPLYTAALEQARRVQDSTVELVALMQLGVLASWLGDEQKAQGLYRQAEVIAAAKNDGGQVQLALQHQLALSTGRQGQLEAARATAVALRQVSIATANQTAHLRALVLLGMIARHRGEPEAAIRYDEEALSLARQAGDLAPERMVLCNLANAIIALPPTTTGRELYERASRYASEALALAERLNDDDGRAASLAVLGNVANVQDDPREALLRYREALALFQASGHRSSIAATLVNLGGAHRSLGEGDPASTYYQQALDMYETLDDTYGLARACWNYGALLLRLHEQRGTEPDVAEAKRAAQLWLRAVELERANNMPTVQEHAEALGKIQRWLAAREKSAEG